MTTEHDDQRESYLQQWDAELQWIVLQSIDNFLNDALTNPTSECTYRPYKLFLEVSSRILDSICERERKTYSKYNVSRRELANIMWDMQTNVSTDFDIKEFVMSSAPHLVKAVVDRIHDPIELESRNEMYINFSDGFCNPYKLVD